MADRWIGLPIPDLVLERLNTFADLDDAKSSGKHNKLIKDIRVNKHLETPPAVINDPMIHDVIQVPTRHVPVTDVDVMDPLALPLTLNNTYGVPDVTVNYVPPLDAPQPPGRSDGFLGSRVSDGVRKSGRISERARDVMTAYIYCLTVKKAIAKHGDVAKQSLCEEIGKIVEKGVFEYLDFKLITRAQRKNVICSAIFLKKKYNTKGEVQVWGALKFCA
jgi:hypothetical protein